jgi:hypothetical protein
MKLKMIMAACAAVCTTGSFAATASSCPTTLTNSAAELVTLCAPEQVFYFGGASAQEPGLKTVMNAGGNGVFDTTKPLVRITSTAAGATGNSTAWAGFSGGKRTLVIYTKNNGSGAGVLQLLNGNKTVTTALESTVVRTQDAKSAKAGTANAGDCTITHLSAVDGAVTDTAVCTKAEDFFSGWSGQKVMHMALSDVHPLELDPALGIKKIKATIVPTAYQGFGVIVSPDLYTALFDKQQAAGLLDAACTASTATAACQPSINAADYAGLIHGSVTSATQLVGGTVDAITVARRVKFSGSQAASNIFFAGQAGYIAKTPDADGFMSVISTPDGLAGTVAASGTNFVTTQVLNSTGNVISAVGIAPGAGYAIGVVSLEKAASTIGTAKFVKLNGVSPDAGSTGALGSSKNRFGMQTGYAFQVRMTAVQNAKLAEPQLSISNKIIAALSDEALSDLPGIAYIGTGANSANYVRVDGNNYAPLVRK